MEYLQIKGGICQDCKKHSKRVICGITSNRGGNTIAPRTVAQACSCEDKSSILSREKIREVMDKPY